MGSQRRVLISGASIAGTCLAFWLQRYGIRPLVVERATAFRDGGQNIDITGSAEKVVERMGLIEAVRSRNTQEEGLKFVYSDGKPAGVFPKGGSASFTRDIEILRGDLARVFYDATAETAEYRFGTCIKQLEQSADSVKVHFDDDSSDDFDLVVSAEGIGSSTRRMVMADQVDVEFLKVYISYFRIPRLPTDDNWAYWMTAPKGRVVLVRPGTEDTLSVSICFWSERADIETRSATEQRNKVKNVVADLGWLCPRIVANIDFDSDFYFGPLGQVKARTWSSGRFALVGDAAHCPSPITGMGTSLAILGAYLLAGEIAKNDNVSSALRAYETLFRPYVERAQKLPPGVPRLAYPQSRLGVAVFNKATSLIASRVMQGTLAAFAGSEGAKTDGFELPSYRDYEV
ncbi:FAD-dependent monooxygenase [Aeoliella sp. SH292]|uniref:FAD-dependent monooxygenase n=1 Tax=Aeoliella sp. SH292 TaxID=3454464 RepID=UPI003F99B9A9